VSSGASKLRLLLPKWLLLHAFTIAASITMVFLGRWQWHVAHTHHGNIQYYAYAFQWWAFVGFALLMWYRIVLDYLRKARPDEGDASVVQPEPASRYLAYAPPTSQALDTDPERMRFNAYLADLTAADAEGAELKTADRKGSE
jgi:DNA-binding transcriptional regulator of glucitol operon